MKTYEFMTSNNFFYILIMVFLFQSCGSKKHTCIDKIACKEYEKKLETLSDFLFFEKTLKDSEKEPFGAFFEKITNVKSESDIQYVGQLPPTINDYRIWTAWYSANHNRLRYDRKQRKVYVIPEDSLTDVLQ